MKILQETYRSVVDYHNSLVNVRFTIAGLYLTISAFLVVGVLSDSSGLGTKITVCFLGFVLTLVVLILDKRTQYLIRNLVILGSTIEKKFALERFNLEGFGSFEFQVGEFEESLEKIKPLLTKLGQSMDTLRDIKSAVDWLNRSIKPFQIYVKYIKTNWIDQTIRDLAPKDFESLSDNQFQELALSAEGQKFKRVILNQLYPQGTPKSQGFFALMESQPIKLNLPFAKKFITHSFGLNLLYYAFLMFWLFEGILNSHSQIFWLLSEFPKMIIASLFAYWGRINGCIH